MASTSRSEAARCSPSSAPTEPARRRRRRSSRATGTAPPARSRCSARTRARPDREWRERIGIVLQQCRMRPELTVRETLELYAGYYREPLAVDETIAHVGLAEKADTRAGRLSGGQLRRLDVGVALIGDPDLLFLDEPTTGFDPSARRQAWEVIAGLRDLGKTVFLTTHYMDEAQRLADRVAIIARGAIVADRAPRRARRPRGPPGADQLSPARGSRGGRTADRRAGPGRRRRGHAVDRDPGPGAQPAHRLGARAFGRPRRPPGTAADARGRLPRADRRRRRRGGGGAMSGAALAVHQFRYDQKAFWRNPGAVFFTVALPLMFLFIFEVIFGNDTLEQLGGLKTDHLLRAGDPHPGDRLGDPAERRDPADDRPRERDPQARARDPAAAVGLLRGPGRQRARDLVADAGDRAGDRAPPLRGLDPLGAPAGGPGHAGDRRRQLLLSSGSRSPR